MTSIRTLPMKCPLCSSNSRFAFEIDGYNLNDCESCSHRFAEITTTEQHVKVTYDNSYFNGGGAGYSDYLDECEMLRKRGKMYSKKIDPFSKNKGKLLDVGSAAGCILKGFVDEGWNGMGLEPNASIAEFGRKNWNLDIQQSPFENFKADEKFDLISMIQVVPHFFDQKKAFENASELLKKDGLLLIETWNRNSRTAKLLGRNWHEYAPPSVLHWYSIDGLTNFLEGFGFEKIKHGRPSKKISGKHAKSLLKHKFGDGFLLRLVPDTIIFPYPSEDLFWALYKKN